ncbi:hypothetical protein KEM55_003948 [Ascosphaera atra]|nr:hypothetical protein KEM55_003948 [Ascosphaera atra]
MGTSSYEKSVKGATKVKNAAPKAKYIEYLLTATHDPSSTADVFRFLSIRLSDTAWTVVFKALLVVHILIREATPGVALSYLADNPRILQISGISEVSFQGRNIWAYAEYLQARARAYGDTGIDFVKSDGQGRLRRMTVAKGLLRETEIVQKQIHALLKCSDFLTDEPENEIMLTAFRLVTLDLLTLFSVMNEGTINVLEHYFTLSRPDSEYALKLYRRFSAQTDAVVKFLRTARRFEHATRLQIPNLKHASTDLEKLLEDDLNDPEFDARRKEYRDQKDAEKSGKVGKLRPTRSGNATPAPLPKDNPPTLPNRPATASQAARPQKDLVDFFDSIDPTTSQANTQAARRPSTQESSGKQDFSASH